MKSFCKKQYFKMLIPGTMTYIAFIAQQLSDIIISGQFLGEDAIAGISIMAPVISAGTFFSGLVPYGTTLLYNNEMGKFDNEKASKYFSNSLIFCAILTAIEVLVFSLFLEKIIGIFNPSETVAFYARQYFIWYRYAICLYPLFDLLDNMVYADGDSHLSGMTNTTLMICNIVLSVWLAYTHGVWGIGFATFWSYFICILMLSSHFFKKSNSIRFIPHFSIRETFRTITMSMSHASEYLFKTCMLWFFNIIMIKNYGEEGIIVLSCTVMMINFLELFGGVAEAGKPMLGIYQGEDNPVGVKKIIMLMMKTGVAEGLLVGILIYIFAPLFPVILGISTEHIVELSIHAIRIVILGAVFDCIRKLFAMYYSAIIHPEISVLMTCMHRVVFPCGMTLLLIRPFGMNAIWIALAMSAVLTLLAVYAYICLKYGKNKYPFMLEQKSVIKIYECLLNEKNVGALLNDVEKDIESEIINHGFLSQRPNIKNMILLEIEESAGIIINENASTKVLAEYNIWYTDKPKIIIRYDGKLKNITEEKAPDSIAEYTFSCINTAIAKGSYLLSASQNRVMIEFK